MVDSVEQTMEQMANALKPSSLIAKASEGTIVSLGPTYHSRTEEKKIESVSFIGTDGKYILRKDRK